MRTQLPPSSWTDERRARIKNLLKRTAMREAVAAIAFAPMALLMGALSLCLSFGLIYVGVFLLSSRLLRFRQLPTEYRFALGLDLCFLISSVIFLLLFVFGRKGHFDYSSDFRWMRRTGQLSPNLVGGGVIAILCEFLFAGIRMAAFAVGLLRKAAGLLRLEYEESSLLLDLLLTRNGRTSYQEIAEAVKSKNLVRLLSGLRHVEGIVFLISPPGMTLTDDFRSELKRAVGGATTSEQGARSVPCPACGAGISTSGFEEAMRVKCDHCGAQFHQVRDVDGQWRLESEMDHASARVPETDEFAEYYRTLGLLPGASIDEIKRAYRQMIKKNHPDLVAGLGDDLRQIAESRAKEINDAYEHLMRRKRNGAAEPNER